MARKTIKIMFLGQFIPRKGIDFLLRALANLREYDWILTLMGSGPEQANLERLADRLHIRERVCFLPNQTNREAVAQIAENDLFILPSRFDGWGAVVNEALMCGVPVICSDYCGAAELLQEPWRGSVFPAYSVSGLQAALEPWLRQGMRTQEQAERIQVWTKRIEGAAASDYLLKVVTATPQDTRPMAPWRIKEPPTD